MPDGEEIHVGSPRFMCPEALFNPKLCGKRRAGGIHELVVKAIHKSNVFLRKELYKNIVLCGGSAAFKGRSVLPACLSVGLVPSNTHTHTDTHTTTTITTPPPHFYLLHALYRFGRTFAERGAEARAEEGLAENLAI